MLTVSISLVDPIRTSAAQFCCPAQRAWLCGRVMPSAPGGLRETAWHSKPQTRENAAPQADEAEAKQRASGRASEHSNYCRSARASQRSHARTSGGARATDRLPKRDCCLPTTAVVLLENG